MIYVLALPLAALVNAIAVLMLTSLSIQLSFLSVITGNIIVLSILIISFKPYFKTIIESLSLNFVARRSLGLFGALCVLLLVLIGLYAVSHVLLPTFHYDSLVNWNMRSKLAYFRAEMIFEDSNSLVLKPHYPILFHALQISVMQLFSTWHETVANGVHLLLTMSLFSAVFMLLREHLNTRDSIVTFSLLLGLPLLSMHTGQEYADLPLIGFALVSLLLFYRFIQTSDSVNVFLSALMVGACVWTKSEGLIFCLIPWLCMCGAYLLPHRDKARSLLYPICAAICVSLLWILFVVLHGYPLTPHGGADSQLQLELVAVKSVLSAMFVSGSFGVIWYALTLAGIVCLKERLYSPTLVWGVLSLVGYLAVYLLTSNTEYLLLGQSFDRQMLLPATLLITSFSLLYGKHRSVLTQ